MERTSDVTSHQRPQGVPGVDDDDGDHEGGVLEPDRPRVAVAEAEVLANSDQRRGSDDENLSWGHCQDQQQSLPALDAAEIPCFEKRKSSGPPRSWQV